MPINPIKTTLVTADIERALELRKALLDEDLLRIDGTQSVSLPSSPSRSPLGPKILERIWLGRKDLQSMISSGDVLIETLAQRLIATLTEATMNRKEASDDSATFETMLTVVHRASSLLHDTLRANDSLTAEQTAHVLASARHIQSHAGAHLLLPVDAPTASHPALRKMSSIQLATCQLLCQLTIGKLWLCLAEYSSNIEDVVDFFENQFTTRLASYQAFLRSVYLRSMMLLIDTTLATPRAEGALDKAAGMYKRFVLGIGPLTPWEGNRHSMRHAWVVILTDVLSPTSPLNCVDILLKHHDFALRCEELIRNRLEDSQLQKATVLDVAFLSVLQPDAYLEVLEVFASDDTAELQLTTFATELYSKQMDGLEVTMGQLNLLLSMGMLHIVFGSSQSGMGSGHPKMTPQVEALNIEARRYTRGMRLPCQPLSASLCRFFLEALFDGCLCVNQIDKSSGVVALAQNVPPAMAIASAITDYPPFVLALRSGDLTLALRAVEQISKMCGYLWSQYVECSTSGKREELLSIRKLANALHLIATPILGDAVSNSDFDDESLRILKARTSLECASILVALPTGTPMARKLVQFSPLAIHESEVLSVNGNMEEWIQTQVFEHVPRERNIKEIQRLCVPFLVMTQAHTVAAVAPLSILDTWVPVTYTVMISYSQVEGAEQLVKLAHDVLCAPIKHQSPVAALIVPTYAAVYASKTTTVSPSLLTHFAANMRQVMQALEGCNDADRKLLLGTNALKDHYSENGMSAATELTTVKAELHLIQAIEVKLLSLLKNRVTVYQQRKAISAGEAQTISIYMNSLLFLLLVQNLHAQAKVCEAIEELLLVVLDGLGKEQDFWMARIETIVATSTLELTKPNLVRWWMGLGAKLAMARLAKL